MALGKATTAKVFLGFLVVLVFYQYLFFEPIRDSNRLLWSASQVATRLGTSDAASYAAGALKIAAGHPHGGFRSYVWPPGMFYTGAALIRFTGEEYYGLKLAILGTLLWAFTLTLVFRSFTFPRHPAARWLLIAGIFSLPNVRAWLLGNATAILYSESKSIPLFVCAMSLLVLGLRERRLIHFVGFGLCFGIASNFRALFDLVGWTVCTLVFLQALVRWGVARLSGDGEHRRMTATLVKNVGLAFVVFFLTTLPWRTVQVLRHGSVSMSPGNYRAIWSVNWMQGAGIRRPRVQVNTACELEPVLCAELHAKRASTEVLRSSAIRTFMSKPLGWYASRARAIQWDWTGLQFTLGGAWKFYGWSFLLGGLLIFAAAVWFSIKGPVGTSVVAAAVLGVFATSLAIFAFVDLLPRYYSHLQIFICFAPFWLLGEFIPSKAPAPM